MVVLRKKCIYIVQNIAYMVIHTPNPHFAEKKISSFAIFPTKSCAFLTSIIPQPNSPVFFLPLIFQKHSQAVTKSQLTGQQLYYSSGVSVRQAVHKSSVSQIKVLKNVLSLASLGSSKASQYL